MTNNQLSTQTKRDIAIDTSVWTFQDVKRYFVSIPYRVHAIGSVTLIAKTGAYGFNSL